MTWHNASAFARERAIIASNRSGKTLTSSAEISMHATGRYPSWFTGRRFDEATHGWVCGVSNETLRDTIMIHLLGSPGAQGTGMIPKACIIGTSTARGIADLVDTIRVSHVSGGVSTIGFRSYSSGRERYQGATLHYVAMDEEPPYDIYSECMTRIGTTNGLIWACFTPLLGMSEVCRRYLLEKSPDRCLVRMTIDDSPHFSDEMRQKIIASYQPFEAAARLRGEPTMGSGLVFPVSQDSIACGHRNIPDHWPRIGGMDFGWTHNFAACELAHDRDHDCVYLIRTFRQKESTPVMHCATLRAWGRSLRWSWPRDGRRQTLEGAGVPLMTQYKEQGLDMLWEHAQFPDGGVSVEAGLMDMLDRMQTNRFKVFRELNDFWEEFNLYHRKDGVVFAEHDDLLASARYALMMLRFASTDDSRRGWNRDLSYPKGSVA